MDECRLKVNAWLIEWRHGCVNLRTVGTLARGVRCSVVGYFARKLYLAYTDENSSELFPDGPCHIRKMNGSPKLVRAPEQTGRPTPLGYSHYGSRGDDRTGYKAGRARWESKE